MEMNLGLLKKHPVAVGAIIVVGGLLLYFLYMRGGSSSTAATSGTVTSAQPSNAELQLAAAQLQSNTQLEGAALSAGLQSHVSDEQYQLGLATLSTQLQGIQVQANTQDIANSLAAQTQIAGAQIAGQTQTNLAAISSETQVALGAQQLAGYQSMIQGNVDIATAALQGEMNGQTTGLLGNLFGGLL